VRLIEADFIGKKLMCMGLTQMLPTVTGLF